MVTTHDAITADSETVITTAERSAIASPVGWASILAAAAVTVGLWLVLHLFGIGVGLTAIDSGDPSSLRAAGIGVGVWSLIAPLIALFVGGLVAGRVAPTINTVNAALHGVVVWALAVIAGLFLMMMVVGSMVRGLAATGRIAGDVAGEAISAGVGAAKGASLSSLGLDTKDLVAPLNERLEAQGMKPVSPESLAAAAKEALATSVREGKVDRATITDIVAKRTALSRADAEQLAGQLEQRIEAAQASGKELAQKAATTALDAAEATGKLLMILSITMLVGLIPAIGGAILSVRRERREHVVLPHAITRESKIVRDTNIVG